MNPEARTLLRKLSIFSGLSDDALDAVAGRTVVRSLARGRQLFRRGEPCQGLYVVVEGAVRVYRGNQEGREQTLHVQGPGQSIAEVPLFDGGPYPASARADQESRILYLPLGDFQWLYLNNSEIADAVIKELGRRLRRMVQLVEKISLRDVPSRVAMTLLEYAERHQATHDGVEFELPRTQEELAAELATTRESVARALSGMRKAGTISQKGSRVRIVDIRQLESIAFSGGKD